MAVPQTETLPTLYQYIGSLTCPVTSQPKNRGRGGQIVGLVGQCTEWCCFPHGWGCLKPQIPSLLFLFVVS